MWTDQGARPGLLAALRERWARQRGVLTVCLLGAAGYAAVFLAYGKVAEAAIGAGIMLGYGALLMTLRPHSEAAALLGGGRTDERGRLILTRRPRCPATRWARSPWR